MTDGTTAPLPKAAPILTLDLGQNGGRLAPTSFAELTTWIQTEQSFWTWALQRHFGNHDQGLREAVDHINHALNHAQQAQQHQQSNAQHSQQQLEACRSRLEEAMLRRKLPHSSTTLAKRIQAYRQEAGDQAASYFTAVFVTPQNGQAQFQVQELSAWRGTVEALMERFHLAASVVKGRKQAADQSFEQLCAKAEQLVAEKTEAYDALHRDYSGLADSIRATATSHAADFENVQAKRQSDFDDLKTKHDLISPEVQLAHSVSQ